MSLLDYISQQGRYGDTELAHVTQEEQELLQALGGAGTINPNTGLREYHGTNSFGSEEEPYTRQTPRSWRDTDDGINTTEFHVHRGNNAITYHNVTDTDDNENMISKQNWEKTQKHAEDIGGWDEYAKQDYSGSDFANMTDAERRQIGRGIVKAEGGFQHNLSLDDYKGYMPKYDKEGEQDIRRDTAQAVSDVGEGAQSSLLNLSMQNLQAQSQRGYAITGNPMIDRQRENIYSKIGEQSEAQYEAGLDTLDTYQDNYMEEWERGLTQYISGLDT